MEDCKRCGGSGRVSFKHVKDGVCFRCFGGGSDLPNELARAQKDLNNLRLAWRKASKAARPMIEANGKKAARRLAKIENMIRVGKAELAAM